MQPLTLTPQLMFIKKELEELSYLGLAELRAARNVPTATRVFEQKYERPQPGSFNERLANAQRIFNTFKNPKA